MSTDISIAISARDNYSEALKKMQQTQSAFRKDLGHLNKELDALNKNKVTLKTDMSKAKRELTEAEKAFKATGNEAARLRMEAAQANYDNIRQNLDLVSKSAKQTTRDMENLTGVVSKTENRIGTSGGTSGGAMESLAKAGVFAMVGNAAAGLGGSLIGSAFGSDTGGAITSVLGGAAAGAALGSVVPGLGTAVGAALGALTGAIQSVTQIFESKDDAFQNVVQDQYNAVKQARSDSISNGSGIAASRETAQISFSTLFGNADVAKNFLDDIKDFANVTPFLYDDLTSMGKVLKTYGYQVEELLPMMQKIGDTGAALGMGKEDMSAIATYLGRMKTTGKTTMEYLNPLMERGIPVFDYLAEASGKTKKEVQEMVSRGLIPGADAAKAIADYMGSNFAGAMAEQSKTYEGLTSTLQGMRDEMDSAMGEGYNEQRKLGLTAEIDWLSGKNGDKMQEANRLIGAWQASLENDQEKLVREALEKTMSSAEFAQADAITQGQMLMEAQVSAQAKYLESDGYKLQLESEKALIDQIQIDMVDSYQNAGYELGLKFSEGIINARRDSGAYALGPGLSDDAARGAQARRGRERNYGSHAVGLPRVPYDNFLTLLHDGERVQTAAQARESDSQGGGIVITGNSFTIREEADIDRVATALYERISSAQASYVGR